MTRFEKHIKALIDCSQASEFRWSALDAAVKGILCEVASGGLGRAELNRALRELVPVMESPPYEQSPALVVVCASLTEAGGDPSLTIPGALRYLALVLRLALGL